MTDHRPLEGRSALVTGAGRGIGRAVALKLGRAGARLVVNDVDEAVAAETAESLRAAGVPVLAVPGDVTATDFAERFVGDAADVFGVPDILVNNAGYPWDGVIQKTSDEQFAAMLGVHLEAPFRILRALAPLVRDAARREREEEREVFRKVVNISSLSGVGGNAGQTGYATAKAGIVGMTKTLAKEWGRYRVNVNAVAFGLIDTRLVTALGEEARVTVGERSVPVGLDPAVLRSLSDAIPLGRPGRVEEAAGAIYLFCIPESDYVSGQVLVCAGGLNI